MKTNIFKPDLLKGPILQSLVLFSIPILISNMFQQLYNTVDTMIVGHYLGEASLAAIGACGSIYELLVGFAVGIGNGLSIVTARSFGLQDEHLLKKSVASSLIVGFGCAFIITIMGSTILYPLLEILDTPAEIIQESYSYISIMVACLVIMFTYNLCSGMLRSIGNSMMPLVFLIISSVLNIILDIILITQFNLGIKGAAIATVISQAIASACCIVYILRYTKILVPQKIHFKIDMTLIKEMLAQGLSMGFMGSIVSIGSVTLQKGINGLGTLIIAAHTASRKLYGFFNMPFISLALATSTFISQNKGANQKDRIIDGLKCAYVFDFVMAAIVSVFLFIFSEDLVAWLSGSTEPAIIMNGSLYLRIVGPFYAVLGVLMQTRFALQGIGSKLLPLISSIIELIGKILFVLLLIPRFGYHAVVWCEPLIWVVMTAQLLYAFYTHPYIRKQTV